MPAFGKLNFTRLLFIVPFGLTQKNQKVKAKNFGLGSRAQPSEVATCLW